MKTERRKLTLIATLLIFFTGIKAQHAVLNLDTILHFGVTDTIDQMPILINTNGNVVVSGNTKVNASQYDATTAEQSINAVTNWISSYNPSGQKAFITCNTHDGSGHIVTAGAVRMPASNGIDLLVICQDAAGTILWTYVYSGAANLSDVATSVCTDNLGNIYVTGGSDATFPGLMDFVTIKLNPAGAVMWITPYNFSNFFDIPTKIAYDAVTDRVIVSGSSGSSFTNYDFVTLAYDAGSGNKIDEERINAPGNGQDKLLGMITDNNGNIYVAGTVFNGTDYDAQVSKLDTSLTQVWTDTLNFHGLDDAALGIALDDSMNVIVVGATHYNTSNKELFIAKFRNNGTRVWQKRRKADYGTLSDAEAVKIVAKNHNELFVGANFTINGNQDLALMRFDENGNQNLHRTYNGPANGREQFMDMTLDASSNKIFVSARSFNGVNDDNIVLNYEYLDIPSTPVTNVATDAHFVDKEVIVRFNRSALKMIPVNDREIMFGTLDRFVNDSTCLKIQQILDPWHRFETFDGRKIPARKIDVMFTENDTLSETRLGDYVRIPEFYASLVLTMPSYINTESAAANIETIKPDIGWSQLNNIYTLDWVPNDSLYLSKQTSLHTSTLYPNAHINVEKAWDYTRGKAHIRAGIFDTGIEESGIIDYPGPIEKHDFSYGVPNWSAIDYFGHGTQVFGIVGAKSDNVNGVAGIAGGGNGDPGVNVVVMKVMNNVLITDAQLKTAYTVGATGSNIHNCLALHVMNSSFGKKNAAKTYELIESVEYANQNGVAFVASRGNYVSINPQQPKNSTNQPATLRPRITMNVGASGWDGNNHVDGVNGSNFTTFTGRNIDFMAPGADVNVYTPYNYYSGPPLLPPAANQYTTFSGTSSAAPHVSGVVSLMMSYRNVPYPNWDNLAHEDCEALLKRSATDQTLSAVPFYQGVGNDTISGFGRINADSALSCLQPKYKIRHIDQLHHSTSTATLTNVVASNVVRYWPGSQVYAPGNYSVDIIEYQVTYTYPFSGETFIDAWPLHKASNGRWGGNATDISDENYYCEVVSASNSSATLKTYAYKFNFKASPPYSNLGGQLTPQLHELKAAFSLYTEGDPTDLLGIKDKQSETFYLNVTPNPSNGNFMLGFSSANNGKADLRIISMLGSTVYEKLSMNIDAGINRIDLVVNYLPRGVYFLNLDIQNNRTLVKKIIIQ